MQEIAEIAKSTDINTIKFMLAGVVALCGLQFVTLIWFAKRKFKQMDDDHELLHQIKTEHKVFHKDETGINNGRI